MNRYLFAFSLVSTVAMASPKIHVQQIFQRLQRVHNERIEPASYSYVAGVRADQSTLIPVGIYNDGGDYKFGVIDVTPQGAIRRLVQTSCAVNKVMVRQDGEFITACVDVQAWEGTRFPDSRVTIEFWNAAGTRINKFVPKVGERSISERYTVVEQLDNGNVAAFMSSGRGYVISHDASNVVRINAGITPAQNPKYENFVKLPRSGFALISKSQNTIEFYDAAGSLVRRVAQPLINSYGRVGVIAADRLAVLARNRDNSSATQIYNFSGEVVSVLPKFVFAHWEPMVDVAKTQDGGLLLSGLDRFVTLAANGTLLHEVEHTEKWETVFGVGTSPLLRNAAGQSFVMYGDDRSRFAEMFGTGIVVGDDGQTVSTMFDKQSMRESEPNFETSQTFANGNVLMLSQDRMGLVVYDQSAGILPKLTLSGEHANTKFMSNRSLALVAAGQELSLIAVDGKILHKRIINREFCDVSHARLNEGFVQVSERKVLQDCGYNGGSLLITITTNDGEVGP